MAPLDPAKVAHYLAACLAAHVSPADVASTYKSAIDSRELYEQISKLSIPDAANVLRKRMGLAS